MYRALKTFSGAVRMRKGEVKAITDKTVVADLIRAGYIEEIKPRKKGGRADERDESERTDIS